MGTISATSVPLTETDQWVTTPEGPGPSEPLISAKLRKMFENVNDRALHVYNRVKERIIGEPLAIESVDATTDQITIKGHVLAGNTVVRIEARNGGTLPGGLSASTAYYVSVIDADNIKLKNTASAMIAVGISSNGTGDLFLYSVPDTFGALISGSAPVVGTYTMPKAFSLTDLLAYIACTLGTTFTGPVRFSGDTARILKRATGSIADSASQTFGVTADVWYHATPTAQRDPEVDDTGAENGDEVEVRRGAAGNFAIILHRPGSAAAICTLPALTCCSARLKRHGGVWTLLSYSGAVVPGADAG